MVSEQEQAVAGNLRLAPPANICVSSSFVQERININYFLKILPIFFKKIFYLFINLF